MAVRKMKKLVKDEEKLITENFVQSTNSNNGIILFDEEDDADKDCISYEDALRGMRLMVYNTFHNRNRKDV